MSIQDIKRISILDYATSVGYTAKKVGRYYELKEHDSVRIDTNKNCFWRNSTGANGSIIDFVMDTEGKDLRTALKDLGALVGNVNYKQIDTSYRPRTKDIKPTELLLPPKDVTNRNVLAYLNQTRKIDSDVVTDFIKRGNLYQDTFKNCVFVSHDKNGKPVFANKRGTNTERRFIADISGCDYSKGFYIDNGANKLIVTESVIDSMSIMTQTKLNGRNYKDFNYLTLSSASKTQAVTQTIKDNPQNKLVILALDDDKAGHLGAEKIHKDLETFDVRTIDKFPTLAKDWNEELILTIKNQGRAGEKKQTKTNTQEVGM